MGIPTTIGLNFSSISNYNLTIDLPQTSQDIIPAMVTAANTGTNGLFTIISMFGIWFALFWITNDKSPFGEFKYSDARAAAVSMGMVAILGISFLEAGLFTNYKHVMMFGLFFVLMFIFIKGYEDRL